MNLENPADGLTVSLKKSAILYQQGELPNRFFYLMKGKVDLVRIHENGSTVKQTVCPGEVLGGVAFFTGIAHREQAVIREDATLLTVDNDSMDYFIINFPEYVFQMIQQFSNELKEANEAFEMANGQIRKRDGVKSLSIQRDIIEVEKYFHIRGNLKYPMLLPDKHEEYLYIKDVECPICDRKFTVNQIRGSKLEFEKNEKDLRKRFKNFDELWYQLWKCPNCGYIHFHNEFFKISPLAKKKLIDILSHQTNDLNQHLIKNNINQVLEDYLYFNDLIPHYEVDIIVKVRLWQSIAWLLDDVDDKELAYKARRVLRLMIEDCWMNSKVLLQPEDDMKLTFKLALLYKEEGDYNQARRYLLTLSQRKTIPSAYKHFIQDELLALKECCKNQKEE